MALHHRIGDLENLSVTIVMRAKLHHRIGDLEIKLNLFAVFIDLHHRIGDLEIADGRKGCL